MSKILLIEDDRIQIGIIKRKLEGEGYQLLIARNAEDGINLAKSEKPDLILMDMILPGMHGLEATIKMKEMPEIKDIPIVALTVMSFPKFIEECYKVGIKAFIKKPCDPKLVVETISKIIGKPTRQATIQIISEESAFVTKIAMSVLRQGHEIKLTYDDMDVVSYVKRTKPDLILLDLAWSGGAGAILYEILKKEVETASIPMLLISSNMAPAELEKKAIELGAEDYFAAPFEQEMFSQKIQKFLKEK